MDDEQRNTDRTAHHEALQALHMPHLYRLAGGPDIAIIERACCGAHSFAKGQGDANWSYAYSGAIEFRDDGSTLCSGCANVHSPLLGQA
jgi:hypothetical protein